MSEPRTYRLSTAEIQTALRMAGLPPAAHSVFAGLEPPAGIDPPIVASLAGKGAVAGAAVSREWTGALRALTAPALRVSVYFGSVTRWQALDLYADAAGITGYAQTPEAHQITFPCRAADIAGAVQSWFGAKAANGEAPFAMDLTAADLTAVAAFVDAYREERLRSILERRAATNYFSRQDLLYELDTGARRFDPRWLTSLLLRHGPPDWQPDLTLLDDGVRALAARGCVRFEQDRAALAGALEAICAGMAQIPQYVMLRSGPAENTSCGPYWHTLLLNAEVGLWNFQRISGTRAPGRLQWAATVESALGEQLATLPKGTISPAASWTAPLSTPAAAGGTPASFPSPSAVPPPPPRPASVPQPPPQRRKVEPPRPAPPQPAARACGKCGKPLPSGRRFCGGCGAPAD